MAACRTSDAGEGAPRRALLVPLFMPHYRLPDHLGLCTVDGRTVMLDLKRDRYFELDAGTAAAFRSWCSGPHDGGEMDGAILLEQEMLVETDQPAICDPGDRARPDHSLLDEHHPGERGAWALVPEITALLWRARRRLKRGLEFATRDLKSRKPLAPPRGPGPQLARFRAARRLVPIVPNCLTDSLALAEFLARRRIACDLIFGVKLNPFAAHCWLQIGRSVMNDSVDSVSTFTPILVV